MFDAFKQVFLRNFSNNNTINADYFTVAQILNQFIKGLRSSILQRICSLHPADLQAAVTNTRDFEAAELKTNHAQAVNLKTPIASKISHVHHFRPINSGNKKCMFATIVVDKNIYNSIATISSSKFPAKSRTISTLTSLCTNNAAINLSTTSISSSHLSTNGLNLSAIATDNISITTTNNLLTPNSSDIITKLTCQWSPKTKNHAAKLEIINSSLSTDSQLFHHFQNPNSQDYLSLLVIPKDASPSNQEPTQKQQTLTSNILPATVTNNKLLTAIFPFEIEEPSSTLLFSGAALNKKPITAMYTDAKVDGQFIKLILDSGSADSIITRQLMDQLADEATKIPIGEINNFPFEVNGIVTPIKVLLTYQGRHIHVPATCGHFKTPLREKLLIELEEEKEKPIWKAYQNDKGKRKEEKKLIGGTNQGSWSDNGQSKPATEWSWEEKGKEKEQEKEPKQTTSFTYILYVTQPQNAYSTEYYCRPCILECNRRPPKIKKWDSTLCLACRDTLLDEGMWKDIPGRERACNKTCQYTILIND
ncbi:hypothetical protein G9A89_011228 [Geosiphon pyriformis]|nr:hypothetical protein G9A89_011228 [Geosiphon pyriformis]